MKIFSFIKKNSSAVLGITILVLIIVAMLLIKNLFMYDENKAIYGSRLDGLEKYKVSSEQIDKMKKKVSESSKKVEVKISGKIIDVIIDANDDVNLESAKKMGQDILEEISDDQKNVYDYQVYVKNEKNKSQFPIIGYKHHSKENISWTKDRAES